MAFKLASTEFADGDLLPNRYSSNGKSVSPPLYWYGAPISTKSLVLIVSAPDLFAGTRIHWLLYGIPAEATDLPDVVLSEAVLADSSVHGRNDWGRFGYEGPSENTSYISFRLLALDDDPDLEPGLEYDQLMAIIEDSVIAEAQLKACMWRDEYLAPVPRRKIRPSDQFSAEVPLPEAVLA